ncbi:hypothetical protein [Flavobacterium laiguense]|uniref:Uncharacterized protein n=1 Tax=Flavobacterium laiguense TaxID=2169409 RepID=A0A2U1JX18_9FLAO|nr:hypothetical protein [Flavobacterium laiguense]PWA09358.1 hypothetical protein DB891_08720 [Flavobacterium laiguense]
MKTFEDLQTIWNQQTKASSNPTANDIIKKAEAHTKKINRNHFWTSAILSLTSLILISYYIIMDAYMQTTLNLGLSIMIGMLLLRILIERISVSKFNAIKTDVSLIEYSKLTHQFYQWRKKIHYILTPIVYVTYIVGFTLLLPVFKENLSKGFYLYILISGFGFLLIFGYFILKIIKKEMQLLDFLKNIS